MALGLIAGATLVPADAVPGSGPLATCVLCGTRGAADLVLNLLLFVPFGAALNARGVTTLRVLFAAALLSAAIELAQLVLPGRNPGWRDLVTNTMGAGFGAMLLQFAPGLVAAGPRARWRLASVIVAGATAVGFTGVALRPLEATQPLYGQWAPRLGHLEAWTGIVTAASLAGVPIPDGPWANADSVGPSLDRGSPLQVRAVMGTPPSRLAPIIAIADEHQRHLVMLGQAGGDAIVSVARRAHGWRLDAPVHVYPGFFGGLAPGAPFALTLSNAHGQPCLRIDDREVCASRFAAGSLWTLLLWDPTWPTAFRRMLDALAVFGLTLPAALLAFQVPRRTTVVGVVSMCAGLIGVAWSTGLALPSLLEWVAFGAAVATGAWRRGHAKLPAPSIR